jgi:flavin reductase (DIM6/NTAB) family NADH-FMN oxidoreductase RutF
VILEPESMPTRDFYRFMISAIVPRPVAWVSTLSASGVANLAPFSYFNGVTSRPPMISLGIGSRRWDGGLVRKDTLRNIEDTKEFVVHVTTESLAEVSNRSAAELPPDVSEIAELGLTAVASTKVKPPRILESPVAMECVLHQIVPLGDPPVAGLVLGIVVLAHVEEAVWNPESGAVDVKKLRPVSRLGGDWWAPVGEPFRLDRPDWKARETKPD